MAPDPARRGCAGPARPRPGRPRARRRLGPGRRARRPHGPAARRRARAPAAARAARSSATGSSPAPTVADGRDRAARRGRRPPPRPTRGGRAADRRRGARDRARRRRASRRSPRRDAELTVVQGCVRARDHAGTASTLRRGHARSSTRSRAAPFAPPAPDRHRPRRARSPARARWWRWAGSTSPPEALADARDRVVAALASAGLAHDRRRAGRARLEPQVRGADDEPPRRHRRDPAPRRRPDPGAPVGPRRDRASWRSARGSAARSCSLSPPQMPCGSRIERA